MKSLAPTLTTLVVLNLAVGVSVFAQNSAGEKTVADSGWKSVVRSTDPDYGRKAAATYTISGSVGVPGVMMRGLPGNVVTDERGIYTATVERTWKGTVTPTKEGYTFDPTWRRYETFDGDRLTDDYTAQLITYTMSGRVGMAGVLMMGLPGNPITNNEGAYSAKVPHGWSGKVVPTKEGYGFMPAARSYTHVTADLNLTNQDYAPTAVDERTGAKPADVYGGAYGPARGRVRGSTGYPPTVGPVGSRRVLVVPADQVDPKQLAEMTEDMQVMSYILDERFKETRRIQGVFIDFGDFFGRDNRATEATYIQGYGVLFAMEVNFSFSPPKPQAQEAEPPAAPADSTWQRAKQQVFSPRDAGGAEGGGSPEEYNSQMVEELKRDLITTLKHAVNIRGLQPDEWVILTVVGGRREFGGVYGSSMPTMGGVSSMSGGSAYGGVSSGGFGGFGGYSTGGFVGGGVSGGAGGGMGGMGGMGGSGGYGGGMGMGGGMMSGMAMGFSSSTVLTIRASKSDVDAFAKGETTFEQFQEQVKILMY